MVSSSSQFDDLNAKSPALGCKSSNPSGTLLQSAFSSKDYVLLNDATPTYFKFKYSEQLDVAICTPAIASITSAVTVLTDQLMDSDHAPLLVSLRHESANATSRRQATGSFDYNKAD